MVDALSHRRNNCCFYAAPANKIIINTIKYTVIHTVAVEFRAQ